MQISKKLPTKTYSGDEVGLSEEEAQAVFRGQSRITHRGQVTVPKEVRERFDLKPGDILCFLEVDGSIVLKLGPLTFTD